MVPNCLQRPVERDLLKPSHELSLHTPVDGSDLVLCSSMWKSTAYMRTPFDIPGRDFKMYGTLRINALPSRNRVQRGRRGQVTCRVCGAPSEILAYIVQNCPRTHGRRLIRHDAVVRKFASNLKNKGFDVESEHLYKLKDGSLKPDIVATSGQNENRKSIIIDVQVISGNNMNN